MTFVSLFCFLIAFGIVLSCLPRGADVLSPARVYGFTWSFALGLADLKLSGYQHVWGAFVWMTFILGILSFLVGVFVVQVVTMNQTLYSIDDVRARLRREILREDILFKIIILFFLCYGSAYIVEWFAYGSLPLFAAFPEKARVEMGIFGVHLFVLLMPIILFLVFEYIILVRKMKVRKLILFAVFALTFVSYFLLLNRFIYAMFFFMVIGFAYYSSKYVKLRYLVVPILLLLAAMIYLQSIRESRYVENYLYVISKMRYPKTYAVFTTPYMYIVMNLENFARAVERLERHAYGYFSFDVVLALSGLKHWIEEYFGLKERVYLVSGYNTFPYLWDYYYDFGLVGVTVFPAIIGSTIALLHKQMRIKPTIKSAALYSAAIFFMVISFFTNVLSSLNFVFAVIALAAAQTALARLSSRRSSPQLSSGAKSLQ